MLEVFLRPLCDFVTEVKLKQGLLASYSSPQCQTNSLPGERNYFLFLFLSIESLTMQLSKSEMWITYLSCAHFASWSTIDGKAL